MFTAALVRALASPDPGVGAAAARVGSQMRAMTAPILADLPPREVDAIVSVLAHVWNSSLMNWANGRASLSSIGNELENATRLLVREPGL
jgi:hypothetical protein